MYLKAADDEGPKESFTGPLAVWPKSLLLLLLLLSENKRDVNRSGGSCARALERHNPFLGADPTPVCGDHTRCHVYVAKVEKLWQSWGSSNKFQNTTGTAQEHTTIKEQHARAVFTPLPTRYKAADYGGPDESPGPIPLRAKNSTPRARHTHFCSEKNNSKKVFQDRIFTFWLITPLPDKIKTSNFHHSIMSINRFTDTDLPEYSGEQVVPGISDVGGCPPKKVVSRNFELSCETSNFSGYHAKALSYATSRTTNLSVSPLKGGDTLKLRSLLPDTHIINRCHNSKKVIVLTTFFYNLIFTICHVIKFATCVKVRENSPDFDETWSEKSLVPPSYDWYRDSLERPESNTECVCCGVSARLRYREISLQYPIYWTTHLRYSTHPTIMLFLVVLLSSAAVIQAQETNGIDTLINTASFPNGIYATCNVILFDGHLDYEAASERCHTFNFIT
eukprot:sb/3464643/